MCFIIYLPIIKNGAARFKPMNSIPQYIAKPNAANVAIIADKLPKSPRKGFERTTSHIIQVIILKLKKKKKKNENKIQNVFGNTHYCVIIDYEI